MQATATGGPSAATALLGANDPCDPRNDACNKANGLACSDETNPYMCRYTSTGGGTTTEATPSEGTGETTAAVLGVVAAVFASTTDRTPYGSLPQRKNVAYAHVLTFTCSVGSRGAVTVKMILQ